MAACHYCQRSGQHLALRDTPGTVQPSHRPAFPQLLPTRSTEEKPSHLTPEGSRQPQGRGQMRGPSFRSFRWEVEQEPFKELTTDYCSRRVWFVFAVCCWANNSNFCNFFQLL